MAFETGPRIYNLFPRLIGSMDRWLEHLPRIKAMGFDWIYLNPFHYPGFSGSLYAVKDYYAYHPLFVNANLPESPEQQLQKFLSEAHRLGLRVMMDLVINHTAFDSVLAEQHPEWFVKTTDGLLKRPGCWDGDNWVEWGDLVSVDNGGNDRDGLWIYWMTMMKHYLAMGIDGFRCDAAYHVPESLWRFLIPGVRSTFPTTVFFAETLGCRPWELIEMADCGFDYVFNSVRWWDYTQPWFPEAQGRVIGAAPSIGFPESHDTARVATELQGNVHGLEQRYLFSALFSAGVLLPVGYEFGFKTKLDVVETYPDAWETPTADLVDFITRANALKASARVFNVDATLFPVNTHNDNVRAFLKGTSDSREKALIVVNLDLDNEQEIHIPRLADAMGVRTVWDVSLANPWTEAIREEDLHAKIAPGACQVLRGDLRPTLELAPAGEGVREIPTTH
jgi:starch synthase (maltosyl-transferring)